MDFASASMVSIFNRDNFDEETYLASQPDVRKAVIEGRFISGEEHFEKFGRNENRSFRNGSHRKIQRQKIQYIEALLREDLPRSDDLGIPSFLNLRLQQTARNCRRELSP